MAEAIITSILQEFDQKPLFLKDGLGLSSMPLDWN